MAYGNEVIEYLEAEYDDDHPLAILCNAFLEDVYKQMGDRKIQLAYTHYQRALDAAEQTLGLSHPQTLQLLKVLSHFCQKYGDKTLAESFEARYAANVEFESHQDSVQSAASLNRVGMALLDKGQYGKAEPLLVRSLEIRERQLGADHPDVAASLNNLAELYRNQERDSEAKPLHVRSLEIRERQLGAKRYSSAIASSNLNGFVCGKAVASKPVSF